MIAEAAYQAVALNPEPAAMFILGIGRFSLTGCDTRQLSTGASESSRPHTVQVLITDDGFRDPYQ